MDWIWAFISKDINNFKLMKYLDIHFEQDEEGRCVWKIDYDFTMLEVMGIMHYLISWILSKRDKKEIKH